MPRDLHETELTRTARDATSHLACHDFLRCREPRAYSVPCSSETFVSTDRQTLTNKSTFSGGGQKDGREVQLPDCMDASSRKSAGHH